MKNIFLAVLIGLFANIVFADTQNLTFATEATYPPFESLDKSGNLKGFDVDIVYALCKKIQANCKIISQPFDSLIPALQFGKIDAAIGAINITPERQKQVDFTDPYYFNSASVVASKIKHLSLDPKALEGKTIGVQSGTTFRDYLRNKYGDKVNIKTYASEESTFLDMISGRIDAVMGDTPLIMQWLKNHNAEYEIVGRPVDDKSYFGKGYGIAIKKGNTQLVRKLNQAIAEIKKDGTYDQLVKKDLE